MLNAFRSCGISGQPSAIVAARCSCVRRLASSYASRVVTDRSLIADEFVLVDSGDEVGAQKVSPDFLTTYVI